MSIQPLDLNDAKSLAGRAKGHFQEFKKAVGGDALWRITENHEVTTSEWSYVLELNRDGLGHIKLIVADCANNINSALDQVAAAIARANGHQRTKNLYYPFGADQVEYQKSMARHQSKLTGYVDLLAATHASLNKDIPHLAAAKEISNTSKHWALLPSIPTAHAVTCYEAGAPKFITQIPTDAFEGKNSFEVYRATEKLPPVPIYTVIRLTIAGLGAQIADPDMILNGAFRYVDGIIEAVSGAVPPSSPLP